MLLSSPNRTQGLFVYLANGQLQPSAWAASGHTAPLLLRVPLETIAIRIQISVFANNR
jgi:hypothetical protein